MKRIERIRKLVPLKEFTAADLDEQIRHVTEDDWLYAEGKPRYICSILGALHEELPDRPDLRQLLLECVWMARRLNDVGEGHRQDRLDG